MVRISARQGPRISDGAKEPSWAYWVLVVFGVFLIVLGVYMLGVGLSLYYGSLELGLPNAWVRLAMFGSVSVICWCLGCFALLQAKSRRR